MQRHKKSRKDSTEKIILATAILGLIKVILEIVKELLE